MNKNAIFGFEDLPNGGVRDLPKESFFIVEQAPQTQEMHVTPEAAADVIDELSGKGNEAHVLVTGRNVLRVSIYGTTLLLVLSGLPPSFSLLQSLGTGLLSLQAMSWFLRGIERCKEVVGGTARSVLETLVAHAGNETEGSDARKKLERQNETLRESDNFDPLKELLKAKERIPGRHVLEKVPFEPQALAHQWKMEPFRNGCEEMCVIMVAAFLDKKPLDRKEAEKQLHAYYERERGIEYGLDIDVAQTALLARHPELGNRPATEYRNEMVTLENIRRLIASGYPVIIPVTARALKNPYFAGTKPFYHMIVLTGYDSEAKVFYAKDPGTSRGDGYPYKEEDIEKAIHDWPGAFEKLGKEPVPRAMLVLGKERAKK